MHQILREYIELNQDIRKRVRKNIRNYNTEFIKTVIENNKNMKVIKNIRNTVNAKMY